MSRNKHVSLPVIIGSLVVMVIAIVGTGEYMRKQEHEHEYAYPHLPSSHGSSHSLLHFQDDKINQEQAAQQYMGINPAKEAAPLYPGSKRRTLEEFYARRAYPGAPPMIPHPVVNNDVIADDCLTCHEKGGYVPQYNAYAPISPHTEMESCRQCHVPFVAEDSFVASNWKKDWRPQRKRSALPSSPPYMPHSLQMRENCLACHAGPAAIEEIRTSHPERVNCLQCHVPQQNQSLFVRKDPPIVKGQQDEK